VAVEVVVACHAIPPARLPRSAPTRLPGPDVFRAQVELSCGKWPGGDVTMTANLYPVYDGADVTATVAHLNAVGPALYGEMVSRNVERLGIRELEVVAFHRLSFPCDGESPNAKWQMGETQGPGGYRRRGREPE